MDVRTRFACPENGNLGVFIGKRNFGILRPTLWPHSSSATVFYLVPQLIMHTFSVRRASGIGVSHARTDGHDVPAVQSAELQSARLGVH